MYLVGPTFELGGPTFESRVGLFLGEGSSKIPPPPLFEQILNSSPMGVFSRDYGIVNCLGSDSGLSNPYQRSFCPTLRIRNSSGPLRAGTSSLDAIFGLIPYLGYSNQSRYSICGK